MFNKILSMIPENVIRQLGPLQFKIPLIGPLFGWLAKRLASGKGIIKYGVGKGLKFNAKGGAPGFLFGTTEPFEQEALKKYLKKGDCFLNIGANFGFFAILAKRIVGDEGNVYAFEPVPDFAKRIKENAALNSMKVEVFQKAACNKNGIALFDLKGVSSSLHGSGSNKIEVETVRVDDLVQKGLVIPPNYCVIDVEGAEIEVLEGMLGTIEKAKPVLIVEIHWIGQKFIDFFTTKIKPLGYHVRNLIPNKDVLRNCERWHAVLEPVEKQNNS